MNELSPRGEPDTYQFRSWTSTDDPLALVRLLQAVETVDHDGTDVREERVRELLTQPGHDPAHDRWVAVSSGDPKNFLGWGWIWHVQGETMATVTGAVLPSWRHRGIGGALLTQALARAAALGATTAGLYVHARNTEAAGFVTQHGFHPVSTNTLLRLAGKATLPPPAVPPGYRMRLYSEIGDPVTLRRAINQCYVGQWGHHTISAEAFAAWEPQLLVGETLLLVTADDAVVGMCRLERVDDSVPYIDAPGVVPELRNENLYAPLLLAAVAYVRDRPVGMREATELESWGDASETLAGYQQLGFDIVQQEVAYERALV